MENADSPAPEDLSARAELLTRQIEIHNARLVEIGCALQLVQTDEAMFDIDIRRREDFAHICTVVSCWAFELRPKVSQVARELLEWNYSQVSENRAFCIKELNEVLAKKNK